MNAYKLIRPLLFSLEPERAHELTLSLLGLTGVIRRPPNVAGQVSEPITVMGLTFPNRVGLAAGLDKNGIALDGLAGLGFGFVEVGTVTPLPQTGNPKPRLFRLTEQQAIINRMGFNNLGVDRLLQNLDRARYKGILGINIGKNAITPMDRATEDYLICLEKVYPRASYVTVNISSPNTRNLRELQGQSELEALLGSLKRRQDELSQRHGRYVPITLKIAPDLDSRQIGQIADSLRRHRIDGVIATNTTIGREGVETSTKANEAGGLSGRPLLAKSTEVVRYLADALAGEVPIIAAGGISCARDAQAKIAAGASLVQLYSGLIFHGPALIHECVQSLNYPLPHQYLPDTDTGSGTNG